VQTVSYAEAVKKVEEDGSRVRDPERIPVNSRSVPEQKDWPTSDICFSKVGFILVRLTETRPSRSVFLFCIYRRDPVVQSFCSVSMDTTQSLSLFVLYLWTRPSR
jgi:hypothetical protein